MQPYLFTTTPSASRTIGALIAAAAGDALGWMTEFARSPFVGAPPTLSRPADPGWIAEYQTWRRKVYGYHSYEDLVMPGDYSDDTQLTICSAAALGRDGRFDPTVFCHRELPTWLEYARGAGRTVKAAARQLRDRRRTWNTNFFQVKDRFRPVDYRSAGANGATMRISPHVLANPNRWNQAEQGIWQNCLATHGHPRAIVGALLYGQALALLLRQPGGVSGEQFLSSLTDWISQTQIPLWTDGLPGWVEEWNKGRPVELFFQRQFSDTISETVGFLNMIRQACRQDSPPRPVFDRLGCFTPETRGSGLGTASAAVYLVARRPTDLETNLLEAANMLGSDTDTIAAMTGGLLGTSLGLEAVPGYWRDQVADTLFLERLGLHLHRISRNENSDFKVRPVVTATLDTPLNRRTIQPAQRVVHAYLGPGEVLTVDIRPRLSGQHAITIARIKFDTGQTCQFVFYSDKLSSSLFACSDTPVLPLTATCQQKQVKAYNWC